MAHARSLILLPKKEKIFSGTSNVANPELYGITQKSVETALSKNIFTTYIPVSAAMYMEDNNINIQYIQVHNGKIQIVKKKFSEALGISKDKLHEIFWNSEYKNPAHRQSVKAPGIDMAALLNNTPQAIFEVKLTVIPTHAEQKVTEMIVRQNTQFNFAERLCYSFGDKIDKTPNVEKLKKLITTQEAHQKPFILHAVWKTIGHTHKLDEKGAFDVMLISDLAYLSILLGARLEINGTKTRIGRVVDHLVSWVTEFKTRNKLTYKAEGQGSRDHLKITLYPIEHVPGLKKAYKKLRLNLADLQKIILPESIKKLAPERRLDASIILSISNKEAEKHLNT